MNGSGTTSFSDCIFNFWDKDKKVRAKNKVYDICSDRFAIIVCTGGILLSKLKQLLEGNG